MIQALILREHLGRLTPSKENVPFISVCKKHFFLSSTEAYSNSTLNAQTLGHNSAITSSSILNLRS
mgnify:CR=1 FL=1